jgi:hypothetical protein
LFKVRWLSKENQKSAKIEDFVKALKQLHEELNWPKPIGVISSLKRNYSFLLIKEIFYNDLYFSDGNNKTNRGISSFACVKGTNFTVDDSG